MLQLNEVSQIRSLSNSFRPLHNRVSSSALRGCVGVEPDQVEDFFFKPPTLMLISIVINTYFISVPFSSGIYTSEVVLVCLYLTYAIKSSDASELSSARFSSDSARARGFPARLGSARDILEPARLPKIGHIRAKIGSVQAMKKE